MLIVKPQPGDRFVNTIIDSGKPQTYPVNGELCSRLSEIIEEYEGRVSTAEVIGLLEMLKISIYNEAVKEDLNSG